MITALAQRIRTECSAELSLFQNQVLSLIRQDIGTGGLEGAATAMARRPSLASSGVTVVLLAAVLPRTVGRPLVARQERHRPGQRERR